MSKKPLILGIESSCDETAASLVLNAGAHAQPQSLRFMCE